MIKNSFEVEVLVNGKPLKEYSHDHRAYIEGKKGSTFSLRMRNNSSERKLFVPSVDGLSVMDGKECSFDSSGYILRPYSAITIDGWRISDEEVAQFYFSSPDKSYRKRMEKGNNLGVVGVLVFDEKQKPRPVVVQYPVPYIPLHHGCHRDYCWRCRGYHCGNCNPCMPNVKWFGEGGNSYSLSSTSNMGGFGVASLSSAKAESVVEKISTNFMQVKGVSQDIGTGWGEAKKSEVTSVEFERSTAPAVMFEIYYNTREQLETLGVNFKKETLYVTPQAFPGQFCEPPQD